MRTTTSVQLITLFIALCGATRSKRGVEVEVIDHGYEYGTAEGAIAAPASGIPIPDLEYGVVDLASVPVPVDAAAVPVQPEVISFDPHPIPLETESVVPNVPFLIQSNSPPILEQELPPAGPIKLPTFITRTVKVGVPVRVRVPVPIPRNVPVPIPQPYPYEITKHVPFEVPRPYPVHIVKEVPVKVSQPYPVPVPIPVQHNAAAGGAYAHAQGVSYGSGGGFFKKH